MSIEERDAPGGRAAALGFYFNADDTWRAGPATPEPWEVTWGEADPDDPPQEAPARRRGSKRLIALGLALIAGTAMALTWSLTPGHRPAPEVAPPAPVLAPPLPTQAPPAETTAPVPAPAAPAAAAVLKPAAPPPKTKPLRPARATGAAPHRRQHVQPAHRRHAAAAHARPRSAAKPPKAKPKSAPASARPARGSSPSAPPRPRAYPFLSTLPSSPGPP